MIMFSSINTLMTLDCYRDLFLGQQIEGQYNEDEERKLDIKDYYRFFYVNEEKIRELNEKDQKDKKVE